jgi:hypothetical protein
MFLIALAALMLVWMLVAGVLMLTSPRRWAKLPDWISLRGSIRRSVANTWFGRLEIRLTGLILSGSVLYMLAGLFRHPITVPKAYTSWLDGIDPEFYAVLSVLTCGAVFACGLVMLFRPGWWIDRFFVLPSEGRAA